MNEREIAWALAKQRGTQVITPKREAMSMRTPDDQTDEALQKLQQMLEEAVGAGADSIELKYVAEGA